MVRNFLLTLSLLFVASITFAQTSISGKISDKETGEEMIAANIQVYIDNPAGIGEHPDLVSAVDQQIQLMSEAQEKLVLVNTYFTHTSDLT